jgi:hypothetical protein
MLAIADANGIVSASIPGLASVSNIEIEQEIARRVSLAIKYGREIRRQLTLNPEQLTKQL